MRRIKLLLPLAILLISIMACSFTQTDTRPEQPANSNPQFVATPAGVSNPTQTPGQEIQPTTQPTGEPLLTQGELYFVLTDPHTGVLSLNRMPQQCLMEDIPCPQVEVVPGYPNVDEYIRPLSWSPDGRMAALPYQQSLFMFTPATGGWNVIVQASIPEQPEWSPDALWIAYIATDQNNQRDIFIVRSDGTGLKNLTGGQFISPEQHITSVFWLDNERLGFWNFPSGAEKRLIEMQVNNAEWTPLLQMAEFTKDVVSYSPDRQKVALENAVNGDTQLWIASSDGGQIHTAGSFGATSIWPLVWSPDGQWVAFSVYGSEGPVSRAQVFAASHDGSTELRELVQAENVAALLWGPDSRHVMVIGDTHGLTQIVVADAQTGESRLIQAPGLPEGARIDGVSWRVVE